MQSPPTFPPWRYINSFYLLFLNYLENYSILNIKIILHKVQISQKNVEYSENYSHKYTPSLLNNPKF